MSAPAESALSTLHNRNFRLFITGQLVSNIGVWVQRIAQDWLVLTLSGSATVVGITTALQFLPTLLFGLLGGLIADRYDKRRVLLLTQASMAGLAGALAVLTLFHHVQVWHVYLLATGLGLVTAVDNPTRQSFVNEMVGGPQLRNAISLNSSVFQLGALIGPTVSGVLIEAVGAGWSFAINAVSFVAPLTALLMIRTGDLNRCDGDPTRGRLRDGLRYVARHPEIRWPIAVAGVFGLFTINLPVTLAAYASSVFHSGAGGYGMLSSAVALGSIAGALIAARTRHIRLRTLAGMGALLSAVELAAAAVPGQWSYAIMLVGVGTATLLLLTSANSCVQIAADDAIRGRVMGIYLLVFIGSGALGGPLVGLVDEYLGPHVGMALAGAAPGAALLAISAKLARSGGLRLSAGPKFAHLPTWRIVAR